MRMWGRGRSDSSVSIRALLAVALLVLALAPTALASSPKASTSIVGGQVAAIDDWPSIASLLSAWDSDGDGELDSCSTPSPTPRCSGG